MSKKMWNAPDLSFYAEKFGYQRFFMRWENENPYEIQAGDIISEFEYDNTKAVVGGSQCEDFPSFYGIVISTVEN